MNPDSASVHASRVERFTSVDLYPVTAEELSGGRSDEEILEAVIAGGVRVVQLRDKKSSMQRLYEKALRFRALTQAHDVLLIINDHVDIAIAIDADGVHLGQDDLPLPVARQLAPDKIIGRSTHSLSQAQEAVREGADYINIGPIYPTGTKDGLHTFLGPEAIAEIAPQIDLPFTVMGGIKLTNVEALLEAGARHIAVVTAITQADDITAAVKTWRRKIGADVREQ